MAQTLIPSSIKFSLDGTTLSILDAQLSLKFENGCSYDECMTKTGVKGYVLKKGTTVLQAGEIVVEIIKTPDGKQDATIKKLQDDLKLLSTKVNPSDYSKTVAVIIENPGAEKFFDLTYSGYVSEMYAQSPEGTNFPQYKAKIQVFDPTSIKISN